MKRFRFLAGLALLLLLAQSGTVSAATPVPTPEKSGGSIYFEILPAGATVWLDNVEVGTSPFTYFSDKTGRLDVRVRKKGFQDYTGTVTVINGSRIIFHAVLTPAPSVTPEVTAPPVPVTIATTVPTAAMDIPTPWPTSTPESPMDPAVVVLAAALGTGLVVVRHR